MEEYWNKLCFKNPAFRKEIVMLKTSSLKAIVKQAWERGQKSSKKSENMFDKLFGSKR